MEAIKKKMQAMKVLKIFEHLVYDDWRLLQVEKDNACDRVDVCEEQCKAAKVNDKDKDKALSFLKMSPKYFNISISISIK